MQERGGVEVPGSSGPSARETHFQAGQPTHLEDAAQLDEFFLQLVHFGVFHLHQGAELRDRVAFIHQLVFGRGNQLAQLVFVFLCEREEGGEG